MSGTAVCETLMRGSAIQEGFTAPSRMRNRSTGFAIAGMAVCETLMRGSAI